MPFYLKSILQTGDKMYTFVTNLQLADAFCYRLLCTFLYIPYNVPYLYLILTLIYNVSCELPSLGR